MKDKSSIKKECLPKLKKCLDAFHEVKKPRFEIVDTEEKVVIEDDDVVIIESDDKTRVAYKD